MSTAQRLGLLERLSDAANARRPMVYSDALRDALRRELARCVEEERPFPMFSQRLLSRTEKGLQALERAARDLRPQPDPHHE